jgi:hypothetical protein
MLFLPHLRYFHPLSPTASQPPPLICDALAGDEIVEAMDLLFFLLFDRIAQIWLHLVGSGNDGSISLRLEIRLL